LRNIKLTFVILILFSILGLYFCINTNIFLITWIGLELLTFTFAGILLKNKNHFRLEKTFKYFLTKILAGLFFIFGSFLCWNYYINKKNIGKFLIIIGLLVKLGLFPFIKWFPDTMYSSKFFAGFILCTYQKIAPLFLISTFDKNFILISCFISFFLCCLYIIKRKSILRIIRFSSVKRMAWITLTTCFNTNVSFFCFFIYTLLLLPFFITLKKFNIRKMNKTIKKTQLIILLLSIRRIPPFLGFFLKFVLLLNLYLYIGVFLRILLIFLSIPIRFCFFRIIIFSISIGGKINNRILFLKPFLINIFTVIKVRALFPILSVI